MIAHKTELTYANNGSIFTYLNPIATVIFDVDVPEHKLLATVK